jgi:hypothetical protein
MQVLILRDTIASGEFVEAGKIYNLSKRDVQILTRMGKATLELPAAKVTAKKMKAEDSAN